MARTILLSSKTKLHLIKLKNLTPQAISLPTALLEDNPESINLAEIRTWFTTEQPLNKKNKYFLELLYALLLKDIYRTIIPAQAEKEKTNWAARLKLAFVIITGTFLFAFVGFDSIAAVLAVFAISTPAMVAIGALFSLVFVLSFYALDLVEISKNLGIKIKGTPKIVDLYLKEMAYIEEMSEEISNRINIRNKQELENNLLIINLLINHYQRMHKARDEIAQIQKKPYIKLIKYIASLTVGIMLFSGGFVAGQSVSLTIAGLLIAGAVSPYGAILLISVAVGLAACALYWFSARQNMNELIDYWLGLDKEKIDKLCDPDNVAEQEEKLFHLKTLHTDGINNLQELENAQHYSTQPLFRSHTNRIHATTLVDLNNTEEINYGSVLDEITVEVESNNIYPH